MNNDTENTENAVQAPAPQVTDIPAPPKRRKAQAPARKARTTSKVRKNGANGSNKGRKWSFERVGLGRGTRLRSTMIPTIVVTVASDNTVRMDKKEMSLTAAAKIIARKRHKKWPSIQGPMYFAPVSGPHKGERLAQMVH
jgi:hypothetical protein